MMDHETLLLILGGIDAGGTVLLAIGIIVLFVRGDVLSRNSAMALLQDCKTEILEAIREWGGADP